MMETASPRASESETSETIFSDPFGAGYSLDTFSTLSTEPPWERERVTSFVLVRVTSWIVPFVQKTTDDPRSHTNQHEPKHSCLKLDPTFEAKAGEGIHRTPQDSVTHGSREARQPWALFRNRFAVFTGSGRCSSR